MLDDVFLADWCDRYLGARPVCMLFRSGHLPQVVAAELPDGRRVVIKRVGGLTVTAQEAAGRQWTGQQAQDAWAAGLWVRLFNAKKDAVDGGGPQLDRLADEVRDRLTLAALDRKES